MPEETIVFQQKPIGFEPLVEASGIYLAIHKRVLFLKLSPHKNEAGFWGVPAGKLEPRETPLKGAQRELFEETGLALSQDHFHSLGTLYIRKPEIDYSFHLFGVALQEIPTLVLSEEHSLHRFVTYDEAQSLPLMKGAKEALTFIHNHKWFLNLKNGFAE